MPPSKKKPATTNPIDELEEAALLSRPTGRGAALAPPPISELDDEDEDGGRDYEDEDDIENAISGLNDPSVTALGPSPRIGGTVGGSRPSDLFGQDAYTLGRATSPKLYAQASQFPTCTQLRVWRWENGIPVGLGAIDATATEEDLVREFYEAMPKLGQGRMQFKLRPIDIRGEEMGKEITLVISEHHAALQQIRRAKKAEEEERNGSGGGPMYGQGNTVVVDRGGDDNGAAYASEMSRMFEKAVEAADSRAMALEQALLEERERLRSEDDKRAQERVDLATSAAQGVQAITERMMRDEAMRAERAMKSQSDQSQMLLTTLTQIFASAQAQQHSIAETARQADQQRLEQERQYAERVRMEQEERRKRDLQEMEERRRGEQARLEDERRQMRDQREFEMKQIELRMQKEREEAALRIEREKLEAQNSLAIAERRLERERQDQELKAGQARAEEERRLAREKDENLVRLERDRQEWQHRWKLEQEERDRRDRLDRQEQEERQRKAEREKEEYNLKLERERLEWQNRWKMEAEERDRRERADREERERKAKFEADLAALRSQELERQRRAEEESQRQREAERQRAHELAVKQMEVAANRDREHAERMMQTARAEMENQRLAAETRLRAEKEDQERREQERLRNHERLLKELELQAQKDREHAERMMQLTQMQMRGDSFGAIGELIPKAKSLLESIGVDPSDLVDRFLNPPTPEVSGGGGGSGWSEALPKMLGALAEVGKAALEAQASRRMPEPQQQMVMVPQQVPAGMAPGMVPGMMPGMMPYMGAPMPGMPGVPSLTPTGPKALGTSQILEGEPEAEQQGELVSVEGYSAPEGEPEEAQQQEEVQQERVPTQAERMTEAATDAGLSLQTQKKARKALRALVRKLATADESDWQGHIATAISQEFSIYHYVKAVTVKAALLEAGAAEDLSDRVINAMQSSGMVPDDVPYE